MQAGCSCFTTWLPTHLNTLRWERWELFSVSTWVSEELVELMTQLEFSRSCPSSLQCRVGWGYPPGQLQNSCSISPDEEDSAQHFGVECGGSISKKSTWLETLSGHSSQHLRAGTPQLLSFAIIPPQNPPGFPARFAPCVPQPQKKTPLPMVPCHSYVGVTPVHTT